MSNTSISATPSPYGSVVPSRQGTDGSTSRPIFLFSSFCPFAVPRFARFHFLTEINGFNGFIFSGKPETAQPVPDATSTHPGYFPPKSFQSHILNFHPTFRGRVASPQRNAKIAKRESVSFVFLAFFRGYFRPSRFPGFAPEDVGLMHGASFEREMRPLVCGVRGPSCLPFFSAPQPVGFTRGTVYLKVLRAMGVAEDVGIGMCYMQNQGPGSRRFFDRGLGKHGRDVYATLP